MKSLNIVILLLVTGLIAIPGYATTPPANADTVSVLKTCIPGGVDENTPNCFSTIASLESWIHNVRTSNNPLLVNIGPGEFGAITCAEGPNIDGKYNNVTFRGAGPSKTKIVGTPDTVNNGYAMFIDSPCKVLNVDDLTITSTGVWGIIVENAFELNSTWTNVVVEAIKYGWIESLPSGAGSCNASNRGTHYWFNSRISVTPDNGVRRVYTNACAESWFFGTELSLIDNTTALDGTGENFILDAGASGETHLYGSTLKLISTVELDIPYNILKSLNNSEVHMHGSGIEVESSQPNDIIVLYADSTSSIHANASAFKISNPGTTQHIGGAGVIKSPYIWQEGAPPNTTNMKIGSELYIDTRAVQPEMFFSNEACGATFEPWVSVKTGQCKEALVPVITDVTPTSLAVGDTVTVYGENFCSSQCDTSLSTETKVKIAGFTATNAYVQLNQIDVTVPDSASGSTGPIEVSLNGNTGYSPQNVTVEQLVTSFPAPTVFPLSHIGPGNTSGNPSNALTLVILSGTNFCDLSATMQCGTVNPDWINIYFNGELMQITDNGSSIPQVRIYNGEQQYLFWLPADAITGPVSIQTPGGIATTPDIYTVISQ